MSPTWRTAALLAAIAMSALVLPVELAGAAALALAGAAVADALLVRARPEVRATVPELVSRGVAKPLAVEVEARHARSVRVRQAAPPDLEVRPPEAEAPLRAMLVARRRGQHRLAPPAARVEGPLGLAAWYRSAPAGATVAVYPDLPAARRIALAARRSRYRDPGVRGRGPLGLGTEFEAVRDYSPDDDIRQVNWLATARLGRPMSNDYRLEQNRDLIAAIDAGRLMAAPIGDRTRLDAALDAVCALAAVADELEDRFGALAFDAEIRRTLRPRRRGGAPAVRELYDLEPTLADSDYARAFGRIEASKRALVILFTDLLDEAAARSLLEAAPSLARRHALLVASVTDPELEAAVATEPASPLDAYRAAVAIDVLEARRRVAARLQRAGAELVEAPAAQLGAACVRAYLRAKARARL